MVNRKRTRAKIVVEPEKRPPFFANRQVQFPCEFFGELFLLFRHLEGAYIPRGHPKQPVFFAAKLVSNGWLLNLGTHSALGKILPTKSSHFCMILTGHIDAASFKPKEIWLEKTELHLWIQGFWSQNELQNEDHDIKPLSFLTAVAFELWYWTTVR